MYTLLLLFEPSLAVFIFQFLHKNQYFRALHANAYETNDLSGILMSFSLKIDFYAKFLLFHRIIGIPLKSNAGS